MKKYYAVSRRNTYIFYSFASKVARDEAVKANNKIEVVTVKDAKRSVDCKIYDYEKATVDVANGKRLW
jgi:hypothetical protein